MNTARLKALIDDLLEAESEAGIQGQLSSLGTVLTNFVNQPQDANLQVEVSKHFESLAEHAAMLKDRWEPAQWADLNSIGAGPFFSNEMIGVVAASIAENSMTPAVARDRVKELQKERDQYLGVLQNSKQSLEALGIHAETLTEGTAEIGFRIPRALFDGNLEGLIKELSALRQIMRAFSELDLGTAEPIHVRQISSSDPSFFFELAPSTIAMLGDVVTWALNTWKTAEEIREIRARTRELDSFSDEEVERIFGDKIKKEIEDAVEKKTAELIGTDGPTGRKAEQSTHLKWALESVLARVERGMTVEIRFLPPPAPAEDEEEDQDAGSEALRAAFDAIKETAPKLSFPKPDPNPVFELPPPDPSSKPPKEGGKTARPRPKQASDE